jgi:hypothetical protein
MKFVIFCCAFIALLLMACTEPKQSPLSITVLKPRDGDTVKTQINNPVEGKAYPGALVTIGFAQNKADTTLIPDDTGRFVGTYKIPTNETGFYSVYITASFQGSSIPETRTVYYIQQP